MKRFLLFKIFLLLIRFFCISLEIRYNCNNLFCLLYYVSIICAYTACLFIYLLYGLFILQCLSFIVKKTKRLTVDESSLTKSRKIFNKMSHLIYFDRLTKKSEMRDQQVWTRKDSTGIFDRALKEKLIICNFNYI